MAEMIRYCGKCSKVFSGDENMSENCPICGSKTTETGIEAENWRNKTSEEKAQLKADFAKEFYAESAKNDIFALPNIMDWLSSSFRSMISLLFICMVALTTIIGAVIGGGTHSDGGILIGIVVGLFIGLVSGVITFGLLATIIEISDTLKEILKEIRKNR